MLEELQHEPLENCHVYLLPEEWKVAKFDTSFYILLLEEDKKLPTSASETKKKSEELGNEKKTDRLQEQR